MELQNFSTNSTKLKTDKHVKTNRIEAFRSRKLLNKSGDYPDDIFTKEEKKGGAIVLHIIGICYMFLGLSIVCDEFFVPALHVISKILNISDDVAGATFMAAGGSAPELFTSIIGVFLTGSNVGFGTIVGSAVFNVLFVIGMCAIFSKTLLTLTWWPLLRDCCFYILALVVLITFFHNQYITWWESLILFMIYILYVVFMVFNERIEKYVKEYLFHKTKTSSSVTPIEEKVLFTLSTNLAKNAFRNGALQLVIHTLDPITEVAVEHKFQKIKDHCNCVTNVTIQDSSVQQIDVKQSNHTCDHVNQDLNENSTTVDAPILKTIDTDESYDSKEWKEVCPDKEITDTNDTITNANQILKELDAIYAQTEENNISNRNSVRYSKISTQLSINRNSTVSSEESKADHNGDIKKLDTEMNSSNTSLRDSVRFSSRRISRCSSRASYRSHRGLAPTSQISDDDAFLEGESYVDNTEEEDGPIDLSFPDTFGARIYYIIKIPLLFLLFFTVPDVRRPNLRRYFPITFICSILWIASYTYLMVWWAAEVGDTIGIPVEVMGLTFLAAGTSIPDLITSVVVARQGLGDMAVSSSIGSNIFDVTVGLPLPWLLRSLTRNFDPVNVSSDGLFCSTILLFIMLLAVLITIAANKWRLTKLLGGTMFLLYIAFLTLTLLIQLDVWPCPI